MPIVIEDSLTLLAAPEKIWGILIDVPRWWSDFHHLPKKYKDPGWSGTLRSIGGEGAAMRFAAYSETSMLQAMCVAQWLPLERLALASEPWVPEREAEWLKNLKAGPGPFSEAIKASQRYKFSIRFDLIRSSQAETKLNARFELDFLSPLLFTGFILRFLTRRVFVKNMRRLMWKFPQYLENQHS